MRQTILAAAAAFVIGGIATGAVLSEAQPAPPPAQQMDGAPPPHPMMGGWMHRMHDKMEHRPFGPGTFALIHRQADRNLSAADVQKIAEAFLLWNGNHTWKIMNVAPVAGGPIGFNLVTAQGSLVAKFTMDPHTGRIQRTD